MNSVKPTVVTVSLADGRRVSFDVDQSATGPAYFVLGIRKCGSTMFNIMCHMLADRTRHHSVLTGSIFFHSNVRDKVWSHDPAICDMLHPGNLYCGFRLMPTAFASHPVYVDGRKILLVRDPRDALVSEYFSLAYSHPVPARTATDSEVTVMLERGRQVALNTPIDEWAKKNSQRMRDAFLGYTDVLRSTGMLLVKYEDYIFRKRELIAITAQHFGWEVTPQQVAEIMVRVDQWPATEDPSAFVRQVTPGDHRKKLSAKTISELNETLKPAMDVFGYRAE
jgi:hypothetical protein